MLVPQITQPSSNNKVVRQNFIRIVNRFINRIALVAMSVTLACQIQAHEEITLKNNWRFYKGDVPEAFNRDFDDSFWQNVSVPHDWAIFGPFDRNNDLQVVAVTQNFETEATEKTGRSGGLPYEGVGWYRISLPLPTNFDAKRERATLIFDGAMSEANVFVNGKKAIFWPYGYNTFYVDITDMLNANGKNNVAVRLENRKSSSRWYPGAGLYRNVRLRITDRINIPIWGTLITTPKISKKQASTTIVTKIDGIEGNTGELITKIIAPNHEVVATIKSPIAAEVTQNLNIKNPELWTPESPNLYRAEQTVMVNGKERDCTSTTFGVRSVEVKPHKGFFLNGVNRKFKGACLHHDLGALGAAINEAAIRRQFTLLKDMGIDALRTSHNMPAPEFVRLADEMGFMVMLEPFDEWDVAKCENGYHRYFEEWSEKDMTNFILQFRNSPSVVMWSVGNEVPTQCAPKGAEVARYLQDIYHRLDPTRPVTAGMDQVDCVLKNGFAAVLDVPGLNYRTFKYKEAYDKLPQKMVLGSETASTVSSRGVYQFPVVNTHSCIYDNHQSSSYDTEYCSWSNIPDVDFALEDDFDWTMGQFIWTGIDYLGEPTPYDTDAWPNHSSMFGTIDLANLEKDRFYLYRSKWNTNDATLHVLPHWNWEGREGKVTPVYVYTSYPEAELFINGKSMGKRNFNSTDTLDRYRLRWNDVVYTPGELKVVAYDATGKPADTRIVKTAGKAQRIVLKADRSKLKADGEDLAYVTVSVVDKDGNPVPTASNMIYFTVQGAGKFRATANGDPTSLNLFHLPQMPLFSGKATAIIQTADRSGVIRLTAEGDGLAPATIELTTYNNNIE